MDALKLFVSSYRQKPLVGSGSGQYITGDNSCSGLRKNVSQLEAAPKFGNPIEYSGATSTEVSTSLSSKQKRQTAETTFVELLTSDLGGSEFELSEYELQVVFQYLRDIRKPCTFFGESDSARLIRCRSYSPKVDAEVFLGVSAELCDVPNTGHDMVLSDLSGSVWTDDYGMESIGVVKTWFRNALQDWRTSLIAVHSAESFSVRLDPSDDAVLYIRTVECLDNYMRRWSTGDIDQKVLLAVCRITKAAQGGDINMANEEFLQLSIGSAPWPIGVGNWGIQERAANDKISAHEHTLKDEVTRKFVQSVKRLLSRQTHRT